MRAAFLILTAAAAAGVILCASAVRSTFPRESGARSVSGIAGTVRIETDSLGIVTVRAQHLLDAMFGIGYAHARDRLWQMEFQRRVGSGRLSEILGKRLVLTDRFLRTVGFRRAAEQAFRNLSPAVRTQLEAYTAGINQYLEESPALPLEFRLLRVAPEPFSPVDCLVWAKMMAWDLASANSTNEIRRARFVAAVGAERAAELFPPVPSEPTILRDEDWASGLNPRRTSSVSRLSSPGIWSGLEAGFALVDDLGFGAETAGSNSWVLAGSRTRSGRPILANDPHLGLRTPSVWYLARLEAPGLSVAGATLPGIPSVIIGHNDRIAWGLTSLEPDVQDLFLEQNDPRDSRRYFHRGAWRTFDRRTETIHVRGASDVVFEVRSSIHGPLVTDSLEGATTLGPAVALSWTGLDAQDTTAEALAAINVARDWKDFLAAAARLKSPAQNLVYADVEGHIGYTASGAIPIRPRADGLLPVSGAGDDDWSGFIPFEELPRVFDPPRGLLVTANNRVASERYPYPITGDWPEPYRARRITDLLLSRPAWSPEEVRSVQLDRVSYQAADLLPLLLDTRPADAASARALERLRTWNREFSPDSVPASIYAAWYSKLSEMPQDELKDTPAGNVRSRFLVNALRDGLGVVRRRSHASKGNVRGLQVDDALRGRGVAAPTARRRSLGVDLGPAPPRPLSALRLRPGSGAARVLQSRGRHRRRCFDRECRRLPPGRHFPDDGRAELSPDPGPRGPVAQRLRPHDGPVRKRLRPALPESSPSLARRPVFPDRRARLEIDPHAASALEGSCQ